MAKRRKTSRPPSLQTPADIDRQTAERLLKIEPADCRCRIRPGVKCRHAQAAERRLFRLFPEWCGLSDEEITRRWMELLIKHEDLLREPYTYPPPPEITEEIP